VCRALHCGIAPKLGPLDTINCLNGVSLRDGLYHVVQVVMASEITAILSDLSEVCRMDVAALIVEQLEADGLLKRLVMRPEGRHPLTVGYPDEVDESPSGPFFFPDEHNKVKFSRALKTVAA
jgi:hypothetical protein